MNEIRPPEGTSAPKFLESGTFGAVVLISKLINFFSAGSKSHVSRTSKKVSETSEVIEIVQPLGPAGEHFVYQVGACRNLRSQRQTQVELVRHICPPRQALEQLVRRQLRGAILVEQRVEI